MAKFYARWTDVTNWDVCSSLYVMGGNEKMNREKEAQCAYENAVKAAKAGNRPLNIWPRDQERVKISDLPVLPEGWAASLKGRSWDIHPVSNDKELKEVITFGHSYALGIAVPDSTGYYMVVETW